MGLRYGFTKGGGSKGEGYSLTSSTKRIPRLIFLILMFAHWDGCLQFLVPATLCLWSFATITVIQEFWNIRLQSACSLILLNSSVLIGELGDTRIV